MGLPSLSEIVPLLQVAVGPVILVSGVGLLLLSMTNRLGRTIDRTRLLARELAGADADDRHHLLAQLAVLERRARLVRRAIAASTVSVLMAATLVITLFLAALLRWDAALLVALLFIGCMGSLILSLVDFLRDVNLSLEAVSRELEHDRAAAGRAEPR